MAPPPVASTRSHWRINSLVVSRLGVSMPITRSSGAPIFFNAARIRSQIFRNKNVTGKVAEEALGLAAITVNKNMVPFDTESPFVTSGIRIGTPAMTTRGFKESEFIEIANLIDQVIQHPESESNHKTVTGRVKEMCDQYPLY